MLYIKKHKSLSHYCGKSWSFHRSLNWCSWLKLKDLNNFSLVEKPDSLHLPEHYWASDIYLVFSCVILSYQRVLMESFPVTSKYRVIKTFCEMLNKRKYVTCKCKCFMKHKKMSFLVSKYYTSYFINQICYEIF